MSSAFESTAPHRFLRPADAGRVRRNMRRIQMQRLLVVGRNVVFGGLMVGAAIWAWRQTQSDQRFAIRHIEVAGAAQTARADIAAITNRYHGANLFQIALADVQRDFRSVSWVDRVTIEKKLPGTLTIRVIERRPVAILQRGERLEYVDRQGTVLGPVVASSRDNDLPLVEARPGAELTRTVEFLQSMRVSDPVIYSRVAQIRALEPRGFAVYDRDLGTTVYTGDGKDVSDRWRRLYGIAAAEKLGPKSIEYADLRFTDRIVVKPYRRVAPAPEHTEPVVTEITN